MKKKQKTRSRKVVSRKVAAAKHTPAEITKRKQSKKKMAIISPAGGVAVEKPPANVEDHMLERFSNLNRKLVKGLLRKRDEPSNAFIRMVVHMIRHGNVPETSCRALSVSASVYKAWVLKGFEDLAGNVKSQFTKFVSAVDVAMAQEEAVSVAKIHDGVRDWQAIAWGLERSKFKRWGPKHVHMQSDLTELGGKAGEEGGQIVAPDIAGDIMEVLEQSGALPQLSGAPDERIVDITGPAVPIAKPIPVEEGSDEVSGTYEDTQIDAF